MLTLQTPVFRFTSQQCLHLTYTALSDFEVTLACITHNGTYQEQLLYKTTQSLGLVLHLIQLILPPADQDVDSCILAFKTTTFESGPASILSNVTIVPECSNPGQLKCLISLNQMHSIGWVDYKTSPVRSVCYLSVLLSTLLCWQFSTDSCLIDTLDFNFRFDAAILDFDLFQQDWCCSDIESIDNNKVTCCYEVHTRDEHSDCRHNVRTNTTPSAIQKLKMVVATIFNLSNRDNF
jgi:hypothetical protein